MDILHEIAEVIGTEGAVNLVESMGGARVYVPAKAAKDHPLTLAIGQDNAQRLCDYYSGDIIEIPSKRLFRQIRNEIIREDYRYLRLMRGCKADHLAIKYGLSRRQIFNIMLC